MRTLVGKISIILLLLFVATAALNVVWTLFTVRLHLMEADQRLNRGLADYLVKNEFNGGQLSGARERLAHSFEVLMDINPNIELYLIGAEGDILAYSAPPGRVVRDRVSVSPIENYLGNGSRLPVLGDDPRSKWRKKPFSAAIVSMEDLPKGYLYIILGGEAHDSFFDLFAGSSILRISLWTSLSALVFLFTTAFLLFRHMTVRHRRLVTAMESFRESGFTKPVVLHADDGGVGDEIDLLGTVFSQMSERIMDQINELTENDRLRRELVSNISHDLRTPLASLQGYLETLTAKQERLTSEERADILQKTTRLIARLGRLIEELFELARLDSLSRPADLEPFPIAELVSDILVDQHIVAERKGLKIHTEISDSPVLVSGDIRLLERAIQNLLDNALKFTPEGGEITVVLSPVDGGVRLSVTDTGPGIEADDLPHIFERFYKAPSVRSAPGTGLGLAIARRIANLHDTDIAVESVPAVGSTFSMTLKTLDPPKG